ncbi:MAG: GT-D fold domain-containing glycosyltransferase [Lachnospiraceae bacterium]|nr:GT-D fold domain-containing glycosyltransferase [Lachnospiraceae bacterium]
MSYKDKIKQRAADLDYALYAHHIFGMKNRIRVLTIDQTLDDLLNTDKSLVRFGDGEIVMMRGRSLKLQDLNAELVTRLQTILGFQEKKLMVAIPDCVMSVDGYTQHAKDFWRDHLLFCRRYYDQYCNSVKYYGNAFVTRCYRMFEDKTPCADWFDKWRHVFAGRQLVVVEGAATHGGVGDNLFSLAQSVERIIAPPRNAFDRYKDILKACQSYPKDRLFLLSIGPTAKPLAEDLFYAGYRVIDIGNLDMEYEWFLKGNTDPVPKLSVDTMAKSRETAEHDPAFAQYMEEVQKVIEL